MSEIYIVKNIVNNKVYIGKTSRGVQTRWTEHLRDSENKDFLLYRAIRKYGAENFSLEILEETEFELEREMFYINLYESNNPTKGYNMTMGGEGHLIYDYDAVIKKYLELKNILRTAEFFSCSKDTVRAVLKRFNVESKKNGKQVSCYDRNGNKILTFESIILASAYFEGLRGSSVSNIKNALNNPHRRACGLFWKDGNEDKITISSDWNVRDTVNYSILNQEGEELFLAITINDIINFIDEYFDKKKNKNTVKEVVLNSFRWSRNSAYDFILKPAQD